MLPIEAHLPNIVQTVTAHPVTLLEASPGSGKTTLVPLALMQQMSGVILVLEPRRLATKWAAERVATLCQENIGESVGYLYRFERKVSDKTRLIFLTEGTFLRYLQGNPELKGVDAVVLDEFHERHLATDLAFGLFRSLSAHWKKVPRLVIMSATLDETPLKQNFPELKKIVITTPVFPLEQRYAPKDVEWSKRPLERKILWGIQETWHSPGDMLVFLPGMGEIRRVETLLKERLGDFPARVLILHGQESSPEKELQSIGERKIILATNVAESSITIPGVRIVIDSGLMREAQFSTWSGHTELLTSTCSKASAIQRAGRAARTAEGVCLRLYTENEFQSREPFTTPEILKADLAEVLLELAHWKISAEKFPWASRPEEKKIKAAREQLLELSALEGDELTRIGEQMLEVPLPPRAARVWVEAKLNGTSEAMRECCGQLAYWLEKGEAAKRLSERLKRPGQGKETHSEKFWLAGFSDRIAKGRGKDVVTVTGDTWSIGPEVKSVWDERRNYWLVLAINGLSKSVTKLLPLEDSWVVARAQSISEVVFDDKRQKMIKRISKKLGALTLEVTEEVSETVQGSLSALTKATHEWLQEFKASSQYLRWDLFSRQLYPQKTLADFEWGLFVEEFLLEEKLPDESVRREFIRRLEEELQLYFDHSFQNKLSDFCPTHFKLHDKRNCEIHYESNQPPWIETYIQDFYGFKGHPTLFKGKVPLTIHLWGPHGRALQVTGDLPGFWQRHYPELRKELSRDYPRHFWADDPQTAQPILRKPRT